MLVEDRLSPRPEAHVAQGRGLSLDRPDESPVGEFDPNWLGQGFDDLVAWRARVGDPQTDLRIRWAAEGGGFLVIWDEPDRQDADPDPFPESGPDADDFAPVVPGALTA